MINIKHTFMSFLFLLCMLSSHAAAGLHFEHIDTRGHTVHCIFRDADGVVWAGTSNGLTTIAQLQSNFAFNYVRNEALNETIEDIRQDNLNRLWLLSNTDQWFIYDPRRNHTISDMATYFRTIGLAHCREQLTTIDTLGRLWTSNGKDVFLYNFKNKKSRMFKLPQNSGNVVSFHTNHREMLVATSNHIYAFSIGAPAPKLIAPTPLPLRNHHTIIVSDQTGNLWLAAENKLFCLDGKTQQWNNIGNVHHVKAIVVAPTGQTYIATTNYGLYAFDQGNYSAPVNLRQAPPNTDGLLSNHIENLYFDLSRQALVVTYNKSNLSIGTPLSTKYAIHRLATAANQFQPEDIISFAAPADGRSFWAGSEDGGLFRVEATDNYPVVENNYRGHTISSLFTDNRNQLWTGIYAEGLRSPDGRMLLQGESPYAMVQPIPGGRIFVTLLGKGIVAIDPQTGRTDAIETDNPWIQDIATTNGHVFAVTNSYIYSIDAATLATKRTALSVFGSANRLAEGHRDLMADRRGWLWAVSNVNHSPLYIYDTRTGKTHTLSEMEKYIIYSICNDHSDNIWCTTNQGLVRITTDGKKFAYSRYMFNIRRDFNYNARALFALPDGRLVAGTNRGFISFNPSQLTESTQTTPPKPPIITLLRINSELQVPPQQGLENSHKGISGIDGDIIYTRQLDLSYDENNFLVECRPRGFMTEMAYQYYYQLKGFSDAWTPLNNYMLTLSNLPPGKYDLYLRTSPVSDETASVFHMLHINIRPPFWLSPWGIALWTFLAAIALLGLYLYARNRQKFLRQILEIEQQKKQEEKLNEMKTRFFTNVSHDLRTPLTLVIAPTDELIKRFSKEPPTDNTLFMLNTVKRNADRLLTLVNQILDVRKRSWGKETLYMQPTNVSQLLNEQATQFSSVAQQRAIRLNISLPEQPITIVTDKEKLTKIVNNLVSNSFKFTPDGGTIDIIGDICPSEEGSKFTLTIADTGKGISAKDLPHIFERYYYSRQLHSSHESSGIGLNIVKEYTELMGGTISVGNNRPSGTRFTIELPCNEAAAMPETSAPTSTTQATATAATTAADSAPSERPTVLLADDNADLLNFMVTSLANDFNLRTATNGEEALQQLNNENANIDVVVSDIMMPGTDGLELTRRIKQNVNLSHIPVILLTAKALEDDQLEGLQMGANDYITKPFNVEILRLRIKAWMQRRQVARDQFSKQPAIEPEKLTITTLDQQLLEQAVSTVSQHMSDPDFNVDQLASLLGIHRTGLNRKLQFITGLTPLLFIRSLRMKRARQIMEDDPVLPVSQVAYQVGINNPKTFARYFQEEFGMKPSTFIRELQDGKQPTP